MIFRFKLAIVLIIMIGLILVGLYFSHTSLKQEEHLKIKPSTKGVSEELGSVEWCRLTVVVDNYKDAGLEVAWGLSIFVETPSVKILFDTGPDPVVLERNLRRLGIDPGGIDFVVISHEHGDHVGGLAYLAREKPGVKVYTPKSVGRKLKVPGLEIVEVDNTTKIVDGVAIIGWLYGPPIEQALAVNVKNVGLVIVVGCSHPGVVNFVAKTVRDLAVKPYLVIGGFHMGGVSTDICRDIVQELSNLGVEEIVPIHCSGERVRLLLEQEYPEKFIKCHVGSRITVS